MNAIELLKSQHREAEALFAKLADARLIHEKEQLFIDLADCLAIHSSIEEHHFYPAVRERRTEGIVAESLEQHLEINRGLNRLLDLQADDEAFDAKIKKLEAHVARHVQEEEGTLFPKVEEIFAREELETIAEAMMAEQDELEERGNPREHLPGDLERPAPP